MTTNNEIPLESKQQIINQLKNDKNNIILTSSIYRLPDAYLLKYSSNYVDNKIITVTEMREIHSQIMPQFSSYLESTLALDLCNQLQKRGVNISSLDRNLKYIKHNQNLAIIGYKQTSQKRYQTRTILNHILDIIDGKYTWEWVILNYDKPMVNAEDIQKSMHTFMPFSKQHQFSRILMSAYDNELFNNQTCKQQFHITTLPDVKSYQEVKQEACMILQYLYPLLNKKRELIEHILDSPELRHHYECKNLSASIFIEGIRKFYDAYSNICSTGYLFTDMEAIMLIQEYIEIVTEEKKHVKIKKPKLYI